MRSVLVSLLAVLLSACATLPELPVEESVAPSVELQGTAPSIVTAPLHEYAERALGRVADGESAHWLLDSNDLALNARLALIDTATGTLDVQYFIWQDDATGTLVAERLLAAADRGVRVRVLIDDFGLVSRSSALLGLDGHDLITVRSFNPWATRGARVLKAFEFLRRTASLNRRMHNKTVIADGAFAILGGRNIGDRYFGVFKTFVQNDLDLLAAGPLSEQIAASFESYWASEFAYPVAALGPEPALSSTRTVIAQRLEDFSAVLVAFPLGVLQQREYLGALHASAIPGMSTLLVDPPSIVDPSAPTVPEASRLYADFKRLLAAAEQEVLISSPYFVPDDELLELIRALTESGVRVAIITNSLETNNHIVAHTGYRRLRRAVLRAGAELYELRADAAALELYSTKPVTAAALGLHTKAAVVDGRTTFIGSPNVDPRSMVLNTEIAAVVDSPELAHATQALIERDMQPANAWRVTLDPDGWLTWSSGAESVYRQPARDFRQRFFEFMLNLLPLKQQI